IPLANKGKLLSIRGPAVPVRGGVLCNAAWLAAGDRENVYERIMSRLAVRGFCFRGVVADRKLSRIGRDAVIVIQMCRRACVEDFRIAARDRELLQVSIAVENEVRTVARPVRGFEAALCEIDDLAISHTGGDGFNRAEEHRGAR